MNNELNPLYRSDYLSFVRNALRKLDGTKLDNAGYLEYLLMALLAFDSGEVRRLLVNLPPRHLKTLYFSVCLAAWTLGHNPSSKIMIVT